MTGKNSGRSDGPQRIPFGPGLAALVILVCVVTAVVLSRLGTAGDDDGVDQCAAQIRLIARALSLYSSTDDGALPPADADWVTMLVDAGLAPRELFTSPGEEEAGAVSYFLVPAPTLDVSDGSRVLLSERPGLHPEGTHVVFHDGRVAMVTAAEAERLIGTERD